MTIISLPAGARFRKADWTPPYPKEQINRSEFGEGEQIFQLPGTGRWSVQLEHVPIRGEASVVPWRAFLAQARGRANRFRVPATEGPQHAGQDAIILAPLVSSYGAYGVSVDPNGTVTKTLGTDAWDASIDQTPGALPRSVSFRAGPASQGYYVVGMSKVPGNTTEQTAIDYGFYIRGDGLYEVYKLGVSQTAPTAYADGDIFAIFATASTVFFLRNGVQVLNLPHDGSWLGLDSSFHHHLATAFALGSGTLPSMGSTWLRLGGLPASATTLKAGHLMTVPLDSGIDQLVQLIEDVETDGFGVGTATFATPLRGNALAGVSAETVRPRCLMALEQPYPSLTVDAGQVYSLSFTASEAI